MYKLYIAALHGYLFFLYGLGIRTIVLTAGICIYLQIVYEKHQQFVCYTLGDLFVATLQWLVFCAQIKTSRIARYYVCIPYKSMCTQKVCVQNGQIEIFFLSLFIWCSELVFFLVYYARIVHSGKNSNKSTLLCDRRRRRTRFNYYSSDACRCLRQRGLTDIREKKYNRNTFRD